MEKETEIVILKDGRKITVSELTGMDEMIAAKVVGAEMNTGAGLLQYRAVLNAFAITEIDGEKVKRPTSLVDAQIFLSKFRTKDTARISKAYSRLNDDTEDDLGETPAAEQ